MAITPPRLRTVNVIEGTAATLLASAILATAGGVLWICFRLPDQLEKLERGVSENGVALQSVKTDFAELRSQVQDHERRIYRMER